MQFLYFRIEGKNRVDLPKQILNKDLNFSNEYEITLEGNELILKENKLTSFYNFKNITSIKSIVGKNGAGKSKILASITEFLSSSRQLNEDISFIFCIKDKDEIIAVANGKDIISKNIKIIEYKEYKDLNLAYKKNASIIYFSNSFSWDNYFSKSDTGFYNISFDNKIRNINPKITHSSELYKEHYVDQRFSRTHIEEIRNEQKIKNIKILNEMNMFNITNITITLDYIFHKDLNSIENGLRMYNYKIENISKLERRIYDLAEKKIRRTSISKKEQVLLAFHIRIIDMLFNELENKINIQPIIEHFYTKLDKEKNLKHNKIEQLIENLLIEIEEYIIPKKMELEINKKLNKEIKKEQSEYFIKKYKKTLENDFKIIKIKYQELLKKIKSITEDCIFDVEETGIFRYSQEFYNYVPCIVIKKEHFDEMISFFEFYNENFKNNIFEIAYMALSAGLNARMNLYVNLLDAINQIRNKNETNKSIILLLDEPDLYFHPEWKRTFIADLSKYLEQFFEFNFQIILTTNEPYILSDLNRECIIGLDEKYDKDSRVFSANIYDLLNNQYFMDKYIGEIAINKINEIIKRIELCNTKDEYNTLLIEIDEIGDDIIRAKLFEKVEKFYDKNKKTY